MPHRLELQKREIPVATRIPGTGLGKDITSTDIQLAEISAAMHAVNISNNLALQRPVESDALEFESKIELRTE